MTVLLLGDRNLVGMALHSLSSDRGIPRLEKEHWSTMPALESKTIVFAEASGRYAGARHARVPTVAQGRHDVLNSLNRRSVAASVVLFPESPNAGSELIHQESAE